MPSGRTAALPSAVLSANSMTAATPTLSDTVPVKVATVGLAKVTVGSKLTLGGVVSVGGRGGGTSGGVGGPTGGGGGGAAGSVLVTEVE